MVKNKVLIQAYKKYLPLYWDAKNLVSANSQPEVTAQSIICASWKDLPPISEDTVIQFISFCAEILHIQAANISVFFSRNSFNALY